MYEKLMDRAADCYIRAYNETDVNLRLFWYNAAHGFEMRARKIKLSEVEK
jgi:hypothetical protein